ncbi:MAG TPA: hypothetical protein VH092_16885 [Urbifossiella sp.]|nr:hypothetical protein [Urbifossiella sp.]
MQLATAIHRFRAVAHYLTREVRYPETRADLMAEAVARTWKYYIGLTRRGKDPDVFLATWAGPGPGPPWT